MNISVLNEKISIITITFNAEAVLEETIKSVLSQSFKSIEYIIVDGNSTDGTVNIIKKYEGKIDKWVSEPDKGIYDAMNKGLAMANGAYVLFLNAGDLFYDDEVLTKVFEKESNADAIYGETEIIDIAGASQGRRRKKVPKTLTWKSLKYGMCVCHQSFIVKKEVAPQYNLSYSVTADYDWMMNCLKNSKVIHNSHIYISKFRVGGYSRKNMKKALFERFGIMVKNYGLLRVIINHIIIGFRFIAYVGVKGKLN